MKKSAIIAGEKAAASCYGQNIEQAALIICGDYGADGKVLVRKVLKGDATLLGKPLTLPGPLTMGCRLQPVPPLKNVMLLLRSDLSLVEIYDLPESIGYMNALVPIYGKSQERERLLALLSLYKNPGKVGTTYSGEYKKEFLYAIRQMKEPANFEIVKNLYLDEKVEAKDRLTLSSLQDWLAETQDPRALPLLIGALDSHHKWLVNDAASKLICYFPGKESDAAFAARLQTLPDDLRPMVVRTLLGRGVKLTGGVKLPEATVFQRAEALDKEGKKKEAAALYMQILKSGESNGYILRIAALKCLDENSQAVRERIIKSRLDWLTEDAARGNYLEVTDTARILRELKDERCLKGLMAILPRRDFIFARANLLACLAIAELGKDSARQAANALLREMSLSHKSELSTRSDEQVRLLLELGFLRQAAAMTEAEEFCLNPKNSHWASSYKSLEPLLKALPTRDEGLALTNLLKRQGSQQLPQQAVDFIIYRLGELKEARSTGVLLALFAARPAYGPQTLNEALQSIGGPEIISRMEATALDGKSPVQAEALEVLSNMAPARALPVLRKLVKNGTIEVRVRALAGLSRLGNCDDYKMLAPLADYWKGDRPVHYWVLQARYNISERCRCH
ncbi:MAG: HEAT repeat domain-containing protein [Candidatus Melainabacteria bacterium]|nr:HEAT repeat domain-containing protein [Candidatus Melainabacteria bacterium]